jgi:integrase
MTPARNLEQTIHFPKRRQDRCRGRGNVAVAQGPSPASGRVPRVARLLALALRFEVLIHDGTVSHYAALARLGKVSGARISQIMNLRWLAPDIQEQILYWPPTQHGRDPLTVRQLQTIAAVLDWPTQRRLWQTLLRDKELLGSDACANGKRSTEREPGPQSITQ